MRSPSLSRAGGPELLVPAGVVVVLGLADTTDPGAVAAAVLAVLALAVPARWVPAVLVGAGQFLSLIVTPAVGRLSPLDVALGAGAVGLLVRMWRDGRRLPPRIPLALGTAVLVIGAAATVAGDGGSAGTSFLRITAYLGVGILLAGALRPAERIHPLRALVGVALGQSLLALAGVTDTLESGLPLGRYLGTAGDPFQFGLPVAAAFVAVVASDHVVPDRRTRAVLGAILGLALLGSNTRVAWAATIVAGGLVLAAVMARRGVDPRIRFAMGATVGAVLVASATVVTLYAPEIGLNAISTRVRIDSLSIAWDYLVDNPVDPTGLGNVPGEFPAYNTWLAVAIALSVPFALGFAAFALHASARCRRLDVAWIGVTTVFLAATMTENMVFAGSGVTLSWFLLLGVLETREREPATPRPGPS